MAVESIMKSTVRMKYTANFRGTEKQVQLPIPLISNSQKLESSLKFTRATDSHGPAFCEVPLEWVGTLVEVGGNFQLAEKLTPEMHVKVEAAREATVARMKVFADENQVVEA